MAESEVACEVFLGFDDVSNDRRAASIFLVVLPASIYSCLAYSQFSPAISNPNGLLSQKVCQYLDQGRTLKDILMRPHIEWLTLIVAN